MSYERQQRVTFSSAPREAADQSQQAEVQKAVENVASNAEKLVNAAEQTGSGESVDTRGGGFSDYLQSLREGVKHLKETLAGVNWEVLANDSKERAQACVINLIKITREFAGSSLEFLSEHVKPRIKQLSNSLLESLNKLYDSLFEPPADLHEHTLSSVPDLIPGELMALDSIPGPNNPSASQTMENVCDLNEPQSALGGISIIDRLRHEHRDILTQSTEEMLRQLETADNLIARFQVIDSSLEALEGEIKTAYGDLGTHITENAGGVTNVTVSLEAQIAELIQRRDELEASREKTQEALKAAQENLKSFVSEAELQSFTTPPQTLEERLKVSAKGLRFNTPSDLSDPIAKALLDIAVPLVPNKLPQLVDITRDLVRLGGELIENGVSFTHPITGKAIIVSQLPDHTLKGNVLIMDNSGALLHETLWTHQIDAMVKMFISSGHQPDIFGDVHQWTIADREDISAPSSSRPLSLNEVVSSWKQFANDLEQESVVFHSPSGERIKIMREAASDKLNVELTSAGGESKTKQGLEVDAVKTALQLFFKHVQSEESDKPNELRKDLSNVRKNFKTWLEYEGLEVKVSGSKHTFKIGYGDFSIKARLDPSSLVWEVKHGEEPKEVFVNAVDAFKEIRSMLAVWRAEFHEMHLDAMEPEQENILAPSNSPQDVMQPEATHKPTYTTSYQDFIRSVEKEFKQRRESLKHGPDMSQEHELKHTR